jgi:hypothetical protein
MATMWFRILSLVIGTALIAKASIALANRKRFYVARSRQYASESQPLKLLIASTIVGTLTLIAWYATIVDYRATAWVVTGFLTALSCMALDHVFRWEKHRQMMEKIVSNPKVWLIDCVLLAVGAGFVTLALLVY